MIYEWQLQKITWLSYNNRVLYVLVGGDRSHWGVGIQSLWFSGDTLIWKPLLVSYAYISEQNYLNRLLCSRSDKRVPRCCISVRCESIRKVFIVCLAVDRSNKRRWRRTVEPYSGTLCWPTPLKLIRYVHDNDITTHCSCREKTKRPN